MTHLVWFKQDLRLHDNPALYHSCKIANDGVIALYLITPSFWQQHADAAIKIEFWRRHLETLQTELAALNIPLLIKIVDAPQKADKIIFDICKEHSITKVFFNKNYEFNEAQRDQAVCKKLISENIAVETFDDQCILAPGNLLNQQGNPYTVFTPFKRAWLLRVQITDLHPLAKPKAQKILSVAASPIPKKISGFEFNLDEELWPVGEKIALDKLKKFVAEPIQDYQKLRDFPAIEGTSKLSPYLTAGIISVKQCLIAAVNANDGSLAEGNQGIVTWVSELIWREFYRHIMVAFPQVSKHQPFQEKTRHLRWKQNEKLLQAWQQGQTGIPIVDAAMRQLNTTGWMHNRLRMVVAMFFTKNLFLDWRLGEKYFMQHLIDGDFASNNGGWQWSASTGTDAAPYFRVMNPISQSLRFDPDGNFIRHYCPELAALEGHDIHNPYEFVPLLMQNNIYPCPIVDLKTSRIYAIEQFKQLK